MTFIRQNNWEVLKRIGTLLFACFVLMNATSPYLSRLMMAGEMEVESLLMNERLDKPIEGASTIGMEGGDWEAPTGGEFFLISTDYFSYSIQPTGQQWQTEALTAHALLKRYIFYRSLRVAC